MPDVDRELAALGLVLGLVGGTYKHTDLPDGPNGQHDFEINTGERTIALEVTSTTVGEVRTMWDAVGRHLWECTKCSWGWSISVEAAGPGKRGTPIGPLRRKIEEHLVVLEQAGVLHFGASHPLPTDPSSADAVLALEKLGVRQGGCLGLPRHPDIPPQIGLGTSGPAGVADPDNLNPAVGRAIQNNIEKLRRAAVDERHLFVWVDSTDSICFAPLTFGTLPTTQPTMAEDLDKVWVAAELPGPTVPTSVLWAVTASGPWASENIRYQDVSTTLG